MYSLTVLIISAAIALLAGVGLGMLLSQRVTPAGQKRREAERQLDDILQAKKAYEDEVVEHFSDTARLLNQLTESYRDVHNHLARGAADLCRGEGPVALEKMERRTDLAELPADLADIEPPKDYAPKASPGDKGVLSEDFGLERKRAEEEARVPPSL
ncbi:YhcB family protein [Mangrovimicrobium sediminis]|uniref:YhcB family protein n=1 Tax=Mangrovimicrobium sediminis TaxID=2562682 RepID=UPI001436B85C|nr:DUF1043 family protein [Haliea sp. SAOS-164]